MEGSHGSPRIAAYGGGASDADAGDGRSREAEYAVCAAAMTFALPENLSAPQAAAFYFPFHLSWLALFKREKLAAGETVLIHAAAGGIGSAAVQLARVAGARVIATAGTSEKLDLCRRLGAEVTINYRWFQRQGLFEWFRRSATDYRFEIVSKRAGFRKGAIRQPP